MVMNSSPPTATSSTCTTVCWRPALIRTSGVPANRSCQLSRTLCSIPGKQQQFTVIVLATPPSKGGDRQPFPARLWPGTQYTLRSVCNEWTRLRNWSRLCHRRRTIAEGRIHQRRDAQRRLVLEGPRNDLHADRQALRRTPTGTTAAGAASALNHCVCRTASRYSTVFPSIIHARSSWRKAGMAGHRAQQNRETRSSPRASLRAAGPAPPTRPAIRPL